MEIIEKIKNYYLNTDCLQYSGWDCSDMIIIRIKNTKTDDTIYIHLDNSDFNIAFNSTNIVEINNLTTRDYDRFKIFMMDLKLAIADKDTRKFYSLIDDSSLKPVENIDD